MYIEFEKLETAIKKFEVLQSKHLESFDDDKLPDLEKQSDERHHEIKNLLEAVSQFIRDSKSQDTTRMASDIKYFNNRITALLEQNKIIEARVIKLKDRLKKGMIHISKGKKAIGSYRSYNAASNKPRVLSVSN